jgi:O-antigen/teichoic acid export membrane protein
VGDQSAGVRDTAIVFISRFLTAGVGFLTQTLVAYYLEPEGRGSLAVAMQYGILLTVIFMLGTDVGCLYAVASRRLKPSEGVVVTLLYTLAGSALAIVVGIALMHSGLDYFDKADPSSFYLVVATIPLTFFSGAVLTILTALREFIWTAIIGSCTTVLGVISLLVYIGLLKWGVNGAILVTITGDLFCLVAALVFLRRRYQLTWAWPSREGLRQILSFGVRYYFGKISNLMNFQLGTLFLASLPQQNEAEIGHLAFALVLAGSVMMVPDALSTVLLPRVAADAEGRVDLVVQCIRGATIATGFALVAMCLLSWPFFKLVLPKYLPCVGLILILAPGIWIRAASKIVVPYLHSRNHVGVTSIAVLAGAAANLGIMWGLLDVIGLSAAALGVVGNYVVSSVILAIAFRQVSRLSMAETWIPRRSDAERIWRTMAGYWKRLQPAAASKKEV